MFSLENLLSLDETANFVPRRVNRESMENLSAIKVEERVINCSPEVWLIGERLYELYLDFTFRVKRGIPLHNTYLPRVVNSETIENLSAIKKRLVTSSPEAWRGYGKSLSFLVERTEDIFRWPGLFPPRLENSYY
jgi:hypothetical protein